MAKTGVFDPDPTLMAKATELKKELHKLVRLIVDDEDCTLETLDQARDALSALKHLKMKKRSLSLKLHETVPCPEEFKCPLSKDLMRDPVILASGQVCTVLLPSFSFFCVAFVCPKSKEDEIELRIISVQGVWGLQIESIYLSFSNFFKNCNLISVDSLLFHDKLILF